jgi:hypothetical protein
MPRFMRIMSRLLAPIAFMLYQFRLTVGQTCSTQALLNRPYMPVGSDVRGMASATSIVTDTRISPSLMSTPTA